jgi:hypothetical protein
MTSGRSDEGWDGGTLATLLGATVAVEETVEEVATPWTLLYTGRLITPNMAYQPTPTHWSKPNYRVHQILSKYDDRGATLSYAAAALSASISTEDDT